MDEVTAASAAARPAPTLVRRLADVSWALPPIVVYLFVIAGLARGMRAELVQTMTRPSAAVILMLAQEVAAIAFAVLQISLFVSRRLPIRKLDGVWPRAVAAIGSNSGFFFLLLPRVAQSPGLLIASTAIITAGISASIVSLAFLGRSFSVLPQARGFVSTGPYRFVRHPLYLCEQVTSFGICCQFVQPWSVFLALGSLGLQILRMRYEEKVLAQTFPAYRDYAARTAQLIPGINSNI